MQSTNFETNIDASKEKINSVYEDSNILSLNGLHTTNYNENKSEDDVSLQSDEDKEKDDLYPKNQDSEDKSSSDLQFSEEEYQEEEVQENVKNQMEIDEEDNIRQYLEEENEFFQDEEAEMKEKENKAKGQKYKINLRSFQTTLIQNSRDRNSIIYLPTGTGKTRISICSMYYYLCKFGTTKKIVFLANTIQLVKQQAQAIKITLESILRNETFAKDLRQRLGSQYIQLNWKVQDLNSQVVCIHGEKNEDQTVTKRKRIQSYMSSRKAFLEDMKKATITVMISQMFLNCLRRGYIKITDYSFVVFDECHHCLGDHPYSGIMKEFYFEQKRKNKKLQDMNRLEDKDRLPIIMGLTASPVSQPFKNHELLIKSLRNLCINLDSNFAVYPFGDMVTNQTEIEIKGISENRNERQLLPELISFFDRYKDHITSYSKIKTHFPRYFKCVYQVIELMAKKHQCLKADVEGNKITDPELYLFYDIKECLLIKLRDLWLELGQFAFILGFHEMINQLSRLEGLRNEENTQLLKDVLELLKSHYRQLAQQYGKCEFKYMSQKVIQLIGILQPSNDDLEKQTVSDMVLVFAFKRRTVKFLQLVLQKYRNELDENKKNFYNSIGVTGYASSQKVYRGEDGHSFQSNPSATENESTISKYYHNFVESEREFRNNQIHLEQGGEIGDNKTLNNEMARMYISKMGKVLLQVEEKYSNQIKKILNFKRKEHRVLITTSVTEEGFDIPGCNLVISFDTPFSLKSYIQIKGRARKKNSRYIIFTNDQKSFNKMQENKKVYDNTINAIYELAINQIAKENINGMNQIEYSPSYKKVATKGGALLNTNYALELLKSYFTSLKHPNRPYFHFIQTSNICFKCIIKFPQSSTCTMNYIVGKPFSTKLEALRSAAFEAVVMLKKEGFIKDDLRPSRLEELEDELELEKYDDLGLYHKDAGYKEIFDRYVQIEECEDPSSKKKLVRFYFKSLEPQKLEFPQLNRDFNKKKFEAGQTFPFQIYLIKFSNSSNNSLLFENDEINEVGILTCFSKEETEEVFAGFKQRFEATCPESFELKLIHKELRLSVQEYNYYKKLHIFLLSGEKNNEVDYYNYLNHQPLVQNPNWTYREDKKLVLKIDQSRQYFPLLVLLKKTKAKAYDLDTGTNKLIDRHIEIFKKIYMFHNKPARFVYQKPFEQSLKDEFQVLQDRLSNKFGKSSMVQCISKDFCFHKGFLMTKLIKYDKNIEAEEEKKKRGKLKLKYEKFKKTFTHFRDQKDIYQQYIMKLELWKQSVKDDIGLILSKDLKMKIVEEGKGMYRFLKEFVLYPVSYQTMLRISMVSKYIFQVFEDYSIALYFRKFYLKKIFDSMKVKDLDLEPYNYIFYKNIVTQNLEKVFSYIYNAGKSKYLRDLGKICLSTLKKHINAINHSIQNISGSFNESMIQNNINVNDTFNHSALQSQIINQSSFILPNLNFEKPLKKKKDAGIDMNLLKNLKIDDILRALTSKIYKHQKTQNYQEFEFIGDVVLKYLATLQIFLEKTSAEEGEMHIARANLICNANLHRAAIKKELFLFGFTSKKKSEPAPIIKDYKDIKNKEEKLKFANTDINILGVNDDDEGYQYVPGKVHADMMEALIGIFYLKNKRLSDCQTLMYAFGILKKPTLHIEFNYHDSNSYDLPEQYTKLQKNISYSFTHKGLLMQALTHPTFLEYIEDSIDENQSLSRLINDSRLNETKTLNNLSELSLDNIIKIKKQQTFYERLQFLGDAFLDMLVVQYLYDKGQKYISDEGTLSFLKQSAVSNKTLGFIALRLGLHELILMNLDDIDSTLKEFRFLNKTLKGMPTPIEFSQLKIGSLKVLGDVFQSLIGAILIDNNFDYEDTKEVVMRMIQPFIRHFTDLSFVEQSPNYKYKQYLDQNNYKKLKLIKVIQEGIINGEYLYRFSDKSNNVVGKQVRASNDKDAWDRFFETQKSE